MSLRTVRRWPTTRSRHASQEEDSGSDRPAAESKAYLRNFTGWSTAYPPGTSEPTSLRIMENMWVDRNAALAVRPGMRYLSFSQSPDLDPVDDEVPGKAIGLQMVGTQEPFYTSEGDKALLCGVREGDGRVGFRAILFTGAETVVHTLTDARIGFKIPQGTDVLNFSAATTHIEYLQIDNKIVALSDAGESVRIFFVGAEKVAKKLNSIEYPLFTDPHKLKVTHPSKAWIDKQEYTYTRNEVPNPAFEAGASYWTEDGCKASSVLGEAALPWSGSRALAITSRPTRVNMILNPLESVDINGYSGWHPSKKYG